MTIPKLGVIGGGQMARALVGGFIDRGLLSPKDVVVIDPSPDSRKWWLDHRPEVSVGDKAATLMGVSGIIMLAVKPNVIPSILSEATDLWKQKLIVSIAAGISLGQLTRGIGHRRVVRVMPNTPSLVGEGASGFCCAEEVTSADIEIVRKMLESVGVAVEVTESQIDAVTGLSGSGPAYVFVMIEALSDGGVAAGLPRAIATQLAVQTVLGAAMMARETGDHPAQLKDNVCSPGGTTIAAIGVLEQNGFRGAVIEAVRAAAARSRELGRPSVPN